MPAACFYRMEYRGMWLCVHECMHVYLCVHACKVGVGGNSEQEQESERAREKSRRGRTRIIMKAGISICFIS